MKKGLKKFSAPKYLAQFSTISHFKTSGDNHDEINNCPDSTTTKCDKHQPPI